MSENANQALEMFSKKFETYKKIADADGYQKAGDTLFVGYTARKKKTMVLMIENNTLAEGFTKGIELYKKIGMDMAVIDISNKGMDAVLEVQRVCPVLGMAKEFGFDKPCHVICEMDVAATKAAFPGTKGDILCAQADSATVCVFKYERPAE